jgi:diguanylate cyclase (GGDEF)-like protein
VALVLCAVAVAAVGLVDYVTGYEIRAYPLYFAPIAFGAWRLPRLWSFLVAVASVMAWAVSNAAAGAQYTEDYVWLINACAHFLAFALIAVLISELRRRLAIERDLSRVDPLTGLANSRAFYERAEVLLAIARRTGAPLTLAYIDLDNFKTVNDEHGHPEGDRALAEVAKVLRTCSRASDIAARLGGDEFAVILHDARPDVAQATLERLRVRVLEAMAENRWPITLSVGALSYPRAPETLEKAVQDADAVMYRVKQAGKDRILVEVSP